jgi:hypothetical protein
VLTVLDLGAELVGNIRVVTAVGGVGAYVLYVESAGNQMLFYEIFQFYGGVVAAKNQLFHGLILSDG